jgi:hypothetical protein
MEEQEKIKRFIYRFYHPNTGAKLNLWATTDEEALKMFSSIVSNVIEWKLRKAARSSKRNKRPYNNP